MKTTSKCVLALDKHRNIVDGSEKALLDAIKNGADLRVYTEFRHNEHIDTSATDNQIIKEVSDFPATYVIDDKVITPALDDGNILPGVTRRSCIELLKKWGYDVEERKISIDEVIEAHKAGKLQESFGTGTAAVISPVGEYNDNGNVLTINDGKIGPISQKLYDNLTALQWGKVEDDMGWIVRVD